MNNIYYFGLSFEDDTVYICEDKLNLLPLNRLYECGVKRI